jgi:hypothetical protein
VSVTTGSGRRGPQLWRPNKKIRFFSKFFVFWTARFDPSKKTEYCGKNLKNSIIADDHYWLFGLSNQSCMTGSLQSDSSQDCGWCTQPAKTIEKLWQIQEICYQFIETPFNFLNFSNSLNFIRCKLLEIAKKLLHSNQSWLASKTSHDLTGRPQSSVKGVKGTTLVQSANKACDSSAHCTMQWMHSAHRCSGATPVMWVTNTISAVVDCLLVSINTLKLCAARRPR